jgi:hypothetical protein
MQNHAASLFTKPTPLNTNLGSDRFSMFNKERDIPPLKIEKSIATRNDRCAHLVPTGSIDPARSIQGKSSESG